MRIQLLPSTFDERGCATAEQRLSCYLIDSCIAIDAGSLALSLNSAERCAVRDIIITHPHLDHIATLPIFIDDLFTVLDCPVRVHATEEVIRLLERDVFNWTIYPRFSELSNSKTRVMEYVPFRPGEEFNVAHLKVSAIPVNHIVPTVGLIFTDGTSTVAFSSDTASTDDFWRAVNERPRVDALLVESSFPNSMAHLAEISGHLTPASLEQELRKLSHQSIDILVMHLKPAYRARVVEELAALGISNLCIMEPGRAYMW